MGQSGRLYSDQHTVQQPGPSHSAPENADKRRLDRERFLSDSVASVDESWDRERCLGLARPPLQLSLALL